MSYCCFEISDQFEFHRFYIILVIKESEMDELLLNEEFLSPRWDHAGNSSYMTTMLQVEKVLSF